MEGRLIVSVLLNLVGVVVLAVTTGELGLVLGLGLPLVVASGAGAWLVHQQRQPLGSLLLGISGALLLPVGGVSLVCAVQIFRNQKYGLTLGRAGRERREVQRPRSWTMAAAIYGLLSVGALTGTLVWFVKGEMTHISAPIWAISGFLLSVLTAIQVGLLWKNSDEATRLNWALAISAVLGLAVDGFYLHSYMALSFLMVPIYLVILVLQGRTKWKGLEGKEQRGLKALG